MSNTIDKHKWYCKDVFSKTPFDYLMGFTETIFDHGIHTHEFFELNIVLSGSAEHQFNLNKLPVSKGDVYIIPPMVPHGYFQAKNLKVFHILVHNLFFDKYSSELSNFISYYMLFTIEPLLNEASNEPYFLKLNNQEFEEILVHLNALEKFWHDTDIQSCIMKDVLGLFIILRLCQFYQEKSENNSDIFDINKNFIEGIRYMFYHYNEKITVEQLAESVHLSKNAFTKNFKKIFHASPGEFLVHYRLTKAINMIKYTELSISKIAQQTGFYDVSHFVKTFKVHEGINPIELRQKTSNL